MLLKYGIGAPNGPLPQKAYPGQTTSSIVKQLRNNQREENELFDAPLILADWERMTEKYKLQRSKTSNFEIFHAIYLHKYLT